MKSRAKMETMRFLPLFAMLLAAPVVAPAQELPASIVKPGTQLQKIATGYKFTEGPIWTSGALLFSDIPADLIGRWKNNREISVFRQPSGHSNGLALDKQGRLLLCQHDRRLARLEKDGSLSVLADQFEGKKLNSPNDLTLHSSGAIYFTDPPYGIEPKDSELGFSGIYRWNENGKLILLDKSLERPNGIALSPNEKQLYVSDSQENALYVFDVQSDGTLANKILFADMKARAAGREGVTDGLKVTTDGTIVTSGPGGVWFFKPNREVLGFLPVPEWTTNVAFGGRKRRTLFITTSKSVYSMELKIKGLKGK